MGVWAFPFFVRKKWCPIVGQKVSVYTILNTKQDFVFSKVHKARNKQTTCNVSFRLVWGWVDGLEWSWKDCETLMVLVLKLIFVSLPPLGKLFPTFSFTFWKSAFFLFLDLAIVNLYLELKQKVTIKNTFITSTNTTSLNVFVWCILFLLFPCSANSQGLLPSLRLAAQSQTSMLVGQVNDYCIQMGRHVTATVTVSHSFSISDHQSSIWPLLTVYISAIIWLATNPSPLTIRPQSNLLVKNSPTIRRPGWACCQRLCIAHAVYGAFSGSESLFLLQLLPPLAQTSQQQYILCMHTRVVALIYTKCVKGCVVIPKEPCEPGEVPNFEANVQRIWTH